MLYGVYNNQIATDQGLLKEHKSTQPLLEDARADNDILIEEVIQAIRGLKKRNASGFDNILAELLQAGSNHAQRVLHKFVIKRRKSENGQSSSEVATNPIVQERKCQKVSKLQNYQIN